MKPAARSFGFGKALVLFSASVSLLFGVVACADPEGKTPDCVQDVGENSHKNIENGCNPFAICVKAPNDPAQCCVDDKGNALEGYELQVCLAGFGQGSFPNAGSGGGGG